MAPSNIRIFNVQFWNENLIFPLIITSEHQKKILKYYKFDVNVISFSHYHTLIIFINLLSYWPIDYQSNLNVNNIVIAATNLFDLYGLWFCCTYRSIEQSYASSFRNESLMPTHSFISIPHWMITLFLSSRAEKFVFLGCFHYFNFFKMYVI